MTKTENGTQLTLWEVNKETHVFGRFLSYVRAYNEQQAQGLAEEWFPQYKVTVKNTGILVHKTKTKH